MSDDLVGGADDLAAYFGMDTPEGRFQHKLARVIERLQGLIDRTDAMREDGDCPSPIEFYAEEDKPNE